jgi:hypothetical protein
MSWKATAMSRPRATPNRSNERPQRASLSARRSCRTLTDIHGSYAVQPISFALLGAGFSRARPCAPFALSVSIPLGGERMQRAPVLIDGEWLRLSARDPSGRPVHLQGRTLQHGGSDARVDQQTDNVFEVDAVSPDGERLGAFRLPFRMQTCTCVTYDGL